MSFKEGFASFVAKVDERFAFVRPTILIAATAALTAALILSIRLI